MKIVITGGAGFIGSSLVNALYKLENLHLVVIDNLSQQIHGKVPNESSLFLSIKGKCEFHKSRVEDINDWGQYLDDADCLVHLAAETGTGQSMYQIDNYHNVNSLATARMANYISCSNTSLKKVIVASSRSVYGEGAYSCSEHGIFYPQTRDTSLLSRGVFDPVCPICRLVAEPVSTSENAMLNPVSVYALTKLYQERLLSITCDMRDISFYGFRLQNVYGPGQSLSNPYTGILSIFSNLIIHGKPINVFEDGLESRDFVYIHDVVATFIEAITCEHAITGIINVGTGMPIDVLTVIENLEKGLNISSNYSISGSYRSGDIRHNYADLSNLKRIIDTDKFVKFEDGISRFTSWVLDQSLPFQDYEGSLKELKSKGLLS